ncbi:MAG: glycosyl hydrolase [Bacteroidetes bacterium]|nr:glycosyl hydrolase [Bacteroidota bacterium]
MMKITNLLIAGMMILLFSFTVYSQEAEKDSTDKDVWSSSTFSGLKFRNIGPALMSGRIADIAIHPDDENVWYVAVGSGGVWKTENAGVTWDPVFDGEKSYSIGCVTVDPLNPHTVWVGTGENIGGRHVGYGDGIYRSQDGGKSWKNMGLKESHHISRIIIHPENSNVLWVAAQGPLWNKGGDRGLYKTTDGGKTWTRTLGDDEWTGVTEVVMDPRNPDRLYAATWQRHRNVAAYMGGGPGSGIHRSTDGGETWEKLKSGLPSSNMGKIGLAISPQKPDILYAAIELDRRTGGVYKSEDRGSSWKKMSNTVSGATGPHYYQELYASPHQFDRIYLMDVRIQWSEDGGKTFKRLSEQYKHSDNHAIAFRKSDPDYLLIGTDGGLYESYDLAENWRFVANLPVTQFYKLALDDAEPFYHIYGGTQDNSTQGGPSRTDNRSGIRNADWSIVLGGDGHQPATEPGNPNIVYAQSQEGELHRIDMITGEQVYIKPQPEAGEVYERNNWDSPILVSPHTPKRIYFASQRVWRSDDRGDSWTSISGDLTRNQERLELPIMDQTWSWDSPWDFEAMSNYNSITSLAESPMQEGLIYAGTDDGLIQVTEDGGENWRRIEVSAMSGVPATAFVNDIKADLYDANTVYVVLDNHKFGDLEPYLFKSTDRGQSWRSIKGNLPGRTLLWRIVQDHVKPEMFFLATEFGIYFTLNGGEKWIQLKAGIPTISFRDLAIQKRENDLVGASFGRGFFVLDDYSPLREISQELLDGEAFLFQPRDAEWYVERMKVGWGEKGSQGAAYYTAPNPPFGATFTYYLKESLKSMKTERKEEEKKLTKEDKPLQFPGWDALEEERMQDKPLVKLVIRDENGNLIREVKASTSKGIHRTTWDLRYSSVNAIRLEDANSSYEPKGFMVVPGTYYATLVKSIDGQSEDLAGPVPVVVKPLYENGALARASYEDIKAYRESVDQLNASYSATAIALKNSMDRLKAMEKALSRAPEATLALDSMIYKTKRDLFELDITLNGNRSKREVGEKINPTIRHWLRVAQSGLSGTYGPTPLHRQNLQIAQSEMDAFKPQLEEIRTQRIPELEALLSESGAPWIEGQPLPEN